MEKLNPLPFFRRFGFRVLLFNALLLLSLIVPTVIIRNADYKQLLDRNRAQSDLFYHCAHQLQGLPLEQWPDIIEEMPRLLYRQRICVFDTDRKLIYDSGIMTEIDQYYRFGLLLPDPYIDWNEEGEGLDPAVYVRFLQGLNLEGLDSDRTFISTRSLRYDAGMDRVCIFGKLIPSYTGEKYAFTMSQSLVDLLIQGRAVKERFLILFSVVIFLGLILTFVLSRSVTAPLKKLYRYSRGILSSKWPVDPPPALKQGGEIGEICRAIHSLINDQRTQAENFRRFSSDVVHELKTPLAAIRSGLELYAESDGEEEKQGMYHRINGRIQQMEALMNEIEQLGKLEGRTETEYSDDIASVARDIVSEFGEHRIKFVLEPGTNGLRVPLPPGKVYRLIVNLVKNAVGFSPEPGSVTLSLFHEDGFLCIRVRDRGPGIPEEALPHITERFYSYRPRDEEKHSGLGLSIVQAILSSCGGSMTCSNLSEGGAEFTCRIPAV